MLYFVEKNIFPKNIFFSVVFKGNDENRFFNIDEDEQKAIHNTYL